MEILALDIGFGETKGMFKDKTFTFRSGFAPFRKSDAAGSHSYGITVTAKLKKPNGEIEEKTLGPYIAGDKSMLYPNFTEPLSDERLGTDGALVLLGEAIVRAGAYGEIALATGAPLDLFVKERESVKVWKDMELTVSTTNGKNYKVKISEIFMQPQSLGAAIALENLDRFPRLPGIGVVIDIGSKTTDIVSLAMSENEEPLDIIRPLCFSLRGGVGDFFNRIGNGIARELGTFRPQTGLIKAAIGKETFSFSGKSCALRPIETAIRNEVVQSIQNEIRLRFGEQLPLVVAVAVVGGGAKPFLLGSVVEGLFPGAEIVPVELDIAPLMNAAGFCSAAKQAMAETLI